MEINNTFRSVIISTVFIAILLFPFINNNTGMVKDIMNSENRQLALKPVVNISNLDAFPASYETYYNDNFSIRNLLVKYYNFISIEAFKKSPVPDKVIIGKDGWLFPSGTQIESYQGINRFMHNELEAFRLELEFRKSYFAKKGCKFYFLVAPDKPNIYKDKIPGSISRFSNQSRGEQLIEYLNKTSDLNPINVYEELRKNKEKFPLYYKLDHHWNSMGAFYAASEVLRCIKKDFPDIEINSLGNYTIDKTEINTGNLVKMLSYTGTYKDFTFKLIPKSGFKASIVQKRGYPVIEGFAYPWEYETCMEIKGSAKPGILIISDSYGSELFPILAESFSRSVKIFDSWQYRLNEDVEEGENPDIVLLVALESNIRGLLNNQARLNIISKH